MIRLFPNVVLISLALALTIAAASASGQSESAVSHHAPTVAETLTVVRQISRELKLIEERLEQSVAGVDASLKPVGRFASPETLRGLILLAAACGAGLIGLHAILRCWGSAGRAKP